MDTGRIHAVILATASGNVVYERFFERYSEQDKAELRAVLAEAAEASTSGAPDGAEFATRYRDTAVAFRKEGDLVYFAVGSGEYDELNLAEVLNLLHAALRDTLKKVPNEALLFDNYGRLCLLVDEMIYEGLLDKIEPHAIQRGIAMKVNALCLQRMTSQVVMIVLNPNPKSATTCRWTDLSNTASGDVAICEGLYSILNEGRPGRREGDHAVLVYMQ